MPGVQCHTLGTPSWNDCSCLCAAPSSVFCHRELVSSATVSCLAPRPCVAGPGRRLMSVAAHSPCLGHKRLFEHPESSPDLVATHKRLRRLSASPHGRRELHVEKPAHALSSTARAALCGLFPDMDEQASSGRTRPLPLCPPCLFVGLFTLLLVGFFCPDYGPAVF